MNIQPNNLSDKLGVIVFIGLSGIGKTTLGRKLSQDKWFHYSVDYRIWTHYLDDELNDFLKSLAMKNPILKDLLAKDAITVEHRVHFNNLYATSVFMGMLGNPNQGGSTLANFNIRMEKHAKAEVSAMLDIPKFQKRAIELYNYPNLLVDASGSLCEVIEPTLKDPVLNLLHRIGTVVYIRATDEHQQELIKRAQNDPKPIYYRPDFLKQHIPDLLHHYATSSLDELDPAEIASFLYPRLLRHRIERYESIAALTGISLSMDEALNINSEENLLRVINDRLELKNT